MSYSDLEAAAQAAKYRQLMQRIAQAKERGQDYELRGAKEIALFKWGSEHKQKWIYKKGWAPYTRDGVIICTTADTLIRWQQFLIYCAVHRLDPMREAHKFGFGPPPPKND